MRGKTAEPASSPSVAFRFVILLSACVSSSLSSHSLVMHKRGKVAELPKPRVFSPPSIQQSVAPHPLFFPACKQHGRNAHTQTQLTPISNQELQQNKKKSHNLSCRRIIISIQSSSFNQMICSRSDRLELPHAPACAVCYKSSSRDSTEI